ncbi:hypothetical protein EJ04DRAFT_517770 [Polyplosphaeria fusca]|uniref:Fucose-specific lectin n=1 Tax=Polyplosphaeria fusca TaxID=682080 RepID=A0A9P4UTU6_9PLEO|nr:hypothetical protein EJ04DRAFT_517770 [Polyplosphaeria fusca]
MRSDSDWTQQEKEVVPGQAPEVMSCGGLELAPRGQARSSQPRLGLRRRWLWFIVGVALMGLVAIVLGATLGVMLKGKESGPVSTPEPSSLAFLSSLAAASWGVDSDDYGIRLIYEDNLDQMRTATFESKTGSWQKYKDNPRIRKSSPLAASRFNLSSNAVQVELFYLAEDDLVSEWNWQPQGVGGRGSLNGERLTKASPSSRLSAYWPFVLYQDQQLHLQGYYFDANFRSPWQPMNLSSSDYLAANGSSLSMVPNGGSDQPISIFHQQDNGDMMEYLWYTNGTTLRNKTLITSDSVPHQAAMTAFTWQPGSASQLATYFLYQDTSATIQMLWRKSLSDSWNGPKTFDAFKDAHNSTGISCLQMNNFFSEISPGTQTPRCYFHASGAVREVEMGGDGQDWKIVGTVPL